MMALTRGQKKPRSNLAPEPPQNTKKIRKADAPASSAPPTDPSSKANPAKPTGKKKTNSQASTPKKPAKTLPDPLDELSQKEPNMMSNIILIPFLPTKLCPYKV